LLHVSGPNESFLLISESHDAMPASDSDKRLVRRIRLGEADAWQECINLFEGRLLAFARSRLNDRDAAEDVVQETFLGFLKALPNYDDDTPLESWLFSIAAHKLIDSMRRTGRRPTVPLMVPDSRGGIREPSGGGRKASSLMRSHEKSHNEAVVVENCLKELIADFKANAAWERLQCVELIFVLGWANKDVAQRLSITEQAVANHKFFVVAKLREAAKKAKLQNANLDGFGLESTP
jgi:RNA polymerase sigma-70 factor (ECF subfamily)